MLLMTYQADREWPKLRHRLNVGYVNNCSLVINLFVVILMKFLTVSFRSLERPPMP